MSKFNNKYRIESHRKPNWNYNANGLYFLTIVTQNRVCNLGKIENEKMILSNFGEIVNAEWHKSFEIRKELILDEFIVMPNHLHAIVEINQIKNIELINDSSDISGLSDNPDIPDIPDNSDIPDIPAETHGRASVLDNHDIHNMQSNDIKIIKNSPIRLPKSISSFLAGFKSSVNSKIDDYIDQNNLSIAKYNRNNHFFQPNYHDHIIRNHSEYINIKNYIKNNPSKWKKDVLS